MPRAEAPVVAHGLQQGLRAQSTDYCFPSRHEEYAVLKRAAALRPDLANTWYYLGNLEWNNDQKDAARASWQKALALKQEIIKEYNDVFDIADVILTPTAPTPAYKIGAQDNDPVKMYLADICTVTVNIASLPGISTTCGYTADGLPIGMSVIGRRFDEQTILQCADAFEQTFAPSAPKL